MYFAAKRLSCAVGCATARSTFGGGIQANLAAQTTEQPCARRVVCARPASPERRRGTGPKRITAACLEFIAGGPLSGSSGGAIRNAQSC